MLGRKQGFQRSLSGHFSVPTKAHSVRGNSHVCQAEDFTFHPIGKSGSKIWPSIVPLSLRISKCMIFIACGGIVFQQTIQHKWRLDSQWQCFFQRIFATRLPILYSANYTFHINQDINSFNIWKLLYLRLSGNLISARINGQESKEKLHFFIPISYLFNI